MVWEGFQNNLNYPNSRNNLFKLIKLIKLIRVKKPTNGLNNKP